MVIPQREVAMAPLSAEECVVCRAGAPTMTAAEIAELQPQIPDWKLIEKDGIPQLERAYPFRNFTQSLAFTNEIAALAEEAGHHPAILTEWVGVTVSWWTHKIKGLHRNDFIMAAKTDELFNSMERGA